MLISTLGKKELHQTHKNANEISKREEEYIQLPTRPDVTKRRI